jgi:2-iminobutanoate/2-iminopropanoate deaminase
MATGRRRSIEIPGVRHSAPIPMGARVDNIVFSSGISGADPQTGQLPEDGREQVRLAFVNLRSFLDAAAVTAEDVVRMTVYVADNDLRSAINEEWLVMFPDADSRPARHTTVHQLQGRMQVQVEVVAVAASA